MKIVNFRTSNMVPEPELPCDIIHENILTRLPVKLLLRFRCVCKSWCELIRTPHFVKLHSKQCKKDPKLMLISYTKDVDGGGGGDGDGYCDSFRLIMCSVEFGKKQHTTSVIEILSSAGFPFSSIMASCNGLVLGYSKNYSRTDRMCLWNPSTGEYQLLPYSPYNKAQVYELESGAGAGTSSFERYPTRNIYGFGYNARANDYEIIMISVYEPYFSRYSIYSLRKKSWGCFQDMPPYMIETPAVGELVNDALHWVGEGHDKSTSVIAFDIGARNFRELSMPPTRFPIVIGLAPINGCLSIGVNCKRYGIEIWMMKDYGMRDSWTKVMKINHQLNYTEYLYAPSSFNCAAMYLSSTQKIGYQGDYTIDELWSTLGGGNSKTEQLFRNCFSATSYIETLVPPQEYDDDVQ